MATNESMSQLKAGLFGYSKGEVDAYIAKLNDDFAETLSISESAYKSAIDKLELKNRQQRDEYEAKIAALKEENKNLSAALAALMAGKASSDTAPIQEETADKQIADDPETPAEEAEELVFEVPAEFAEGDKEPFTEERIIVFDDSEDTELKENSSDDQFFLFDVSEEQAEPVPEDIFSAEEAEEIKDEAQESDQFSVVCDPEEESVPAAEDVETIDEPEYVTEEEIFRAAEEYDEQEKEKKVAAEADETRSTLSREEFAKVYSAITRSDESIADEPVTRSDTQSEESVSDSIARLISDAKAYAKKIMTEAETKRDKMMKDVEERRTVMLSEIDTERTCMLTEVNAERDHLTAEIATAKAQEKHRTEMINNSLDTISSTLNSLVDDTIAGFNEKTAFISKLLKETGDKE